MAEGANVGATTAVAPAAKPAGAKPEKAAGESKKELEAKEAIHAKIRDIVKEKTGTSVGIAGGKEIFDTVVSEIFGAATRDGGFRFPGGYGSLKVVKVAAGKKTLPNGTVVSAPERSKLRYDMGTAVRSKIAPVKSTK